MNCPKCGEHIEWKENRGKVDTGSLIERLESLVKCDSHGGSWRGAIKDLIKEYRHGPSADGKLRAKMAAIVFHAAGRPLTEEENMKICNMALEVTK